MVLEKDANTTRYFILELRSDQMREDIRTKPLIAALAPPNMFEAHSEFHPKALENASKHLKESAWEAIGFSQTAAFAIYVKNKLIPKGTRLKDLVERYRCQNCELGNPGTHYWVNLFKLAPFAEQELKRLKREMQKRQETKKIKRIDKMLVALQEKLEKLAKMQEQQQELGKVRTLELGRRHSMGQLSFRGEKDRKESEEGKRKSKFHTE
jgi:hypothetical protein